MKKTYQKTIYISAFLFLLVITGLAFGWHDETHLVISKAAGYDHLYNSAGADITKTKADGKEATNHWFNNTKGDKVNAEMVLDQAGRYNDPGIQRATCTVQLSPLCENI